MPSDKSTKSLSYDDRFYPTRRAALSYSALLAIFSTSIPTLQREDSQCVGDKASSIKLAFADVCFDTRLITLALILAVLFYTLAFFRAHSTSNILNSQAIAGAAGRVTDAIELTATELMALRSIFMTTNNNFNNFMSDNSRKLTDQSYQITKNDMMYDVNMLLMTRFRQIFEPKNIIDHIPESTNSIGLKEEFNKIDLANLVSELVSNIAEISDKFAHATLKGFETDEEQLSSLNRNVAEGLAKLDHLNAGFSLLSKEYRGTMARWYFLHDIAPTYLLSCISIILGALKVIGVRFQFEHPWVLISMLAISALAVVFIYKWSPWLISTDQPPSPPA